MAFTTGRLLPITGTEELREVVESLLLEGEINTTLDQKRMFVQSGGLNYVIAPVFYPHVANEASMLLLDELESDTNDSNDSNESAGRGVHRGDSCYRIDTGEVYLCIKHHGRVLDDWVLYIPNAIGGLIPAVNVTYDPPTSAMITALNVQDAVDEIVAFLGGLAVIYLTGFNPIGISGIEIVQSVDLDGTVNIRKITGSGGIVATVSVNGELNLDGGAAGSSFDMRDAWLLG